MEAGLAFPFMVMLGFGLFELGGIFYNYELIQTGVRDAARYLARVANPVESEVTARNLAVRGSIDGTAPLRVRWWQPSDVQISYAKTIPNPVDPATGRRLYRGPDPIVIIRVSASLEPPGLGYLTKVGLGPIRIGVAHEERYVAQ
jgi:hypothetical protein